ncbi:hypothetical protein [Cohaesibacter marisflavi]|uniref:hypothetical protein n=1 Tax=Cohaesibacter marisflavi TaxID=655353 RepID=UPI000B7C805E|nr:hypothetical protein [Cohaesibacter marisflavi]
MTINTDSIVWAVSKTVNRASSKCGPTHKVHIIWVVFYNKTCRNSSANDIFSLALAFIWAQEAQETSPELPCNDHIEAY